MSANAGRAREEAFRKHQDGLLEDAERDDFNQGWNRAIAAAIEVVEGHRCYTEEPEGCVSLDAHPSRTCAAAIAAELKRLM